jgi:hypothetical protein
MTLTQMSRRFSQLLGLSLGCWPSCKFSVITVIDRLVMPSSSRRKSKLLQPALFSGLPYQKMGGGGCHKC